jgi:hypothetical protein
MPYFSAIIYGRRCAMSSNIMRNLHVPLPEPTYRRLRTEAQRSNRPATEIAREAIDRWLAEQHRLMIHESVALYAADMAGSSADLDEEMEAAGVETMLSIDAGITEDLHS